MPNQPAKDRPRVMFICDQALADELQDWADKQNRSRSNLIATLLGEIVAKAKQESASILTPEETIDQFKKFISLLLGGDRNGVSYRLLGDALGINPDDLHELVQLVQKCKEEKAKHD